MQATSQEKSSKAKAHHQMQATSQAKPGQVKSSQVKPKHPSLHGWNLHSIHMTSNASKSSQAN
jgi:hypothetical protein